MFYSELFHVDSLSPFESLDFVASAFQSLLGFELDAVELSPVLYLQKVLNYLEGTDLGYRNKSIQILFEDVFPLF